MSREIISPQNEAFVSEIIEKAKVERHVSDSPEDVWILTGSYAINTYTPQSDIDLILVHQRDEGSTPIRKKVPVEDIPVSISIVGRHIFKEDGNQQYGGYFAGKLLNPHHLFNGDPVLRNFIRSTAGSFIGSFAGYLGTERQGSLRHDANELTAHSLLSYSSICPEYNSYLLSYFTADNFDKIWNFLAESIPESLVISGKAVKNTEGYRYTEPYRDYNEFNKMRLQSLARRSGFGVYFHESDYSWIGSYFKDASKKIDRIDPTGESYKEMIKFFQEMSGLQNVLL